GWPPAARGGRLRARKRRGGRRGGDRRMSPREREKEREKGAGPASRLGLRTHSPSNAHRQPRPEACLNAKLPGSYGVIGMSALFDRFGYGGFLPAVALLALAACSGAAPSDLNDPPSSESGSSSGSG